MPCESVAATLTQKRAVFLAFSSREVTSDQMRKIGIHYIIYRGAGVMTYVCKITRLSKLHRGGGKKSQKICGCSPRKTVIHPPSPVAGTPMNNADMVIITNVYDWNERKKVYLKSLPTLADDVSVLRLEDFNADRLAAVFLRDRVVHKN